MVQANIGIILQIEACNCLMYVTMASLFYISQWKFLFASVNFKLEIPDCLLQDEGAYISMTYKGLSNPIKALISEAPIESSTAFQSI